MVSIKALVIAGVVFAVCDLWFGVFILSFYSKIQYEHFHCPWAHGIRRCDYFVYETNHSIRTRIGIVEGIVSLMFSVVLLIAYIRRLPLLAWCWLVKAIIILGLNSYFVATWLIQRSRHYYSYWNPNEYDEETWFITGGATEIIVQLVLTVVFCCLTLSFTQQLKRQNRAVKAAETQI